MDRIPKVDLHIHSIYSDGSHTPSQIVLNAKKKEIDLIALTDHNTFSGVPKFRSACKKYKQKGIAGIEISTKYKDKEIHLLGYFNLNMDFRSKDFSQLKKILKNYKNIKKNQNEAIIQKMIDVGRYDISISEFYSFAKTVSPDENYNRVHIAKYMVYKGLVDSVDQAFDYIGDGCDFFVDKETVSLGKAIKAIRAGHGFAVIAHVGEYNFLPDELELFFNFCKNNGVHGFECFHPSHDLININAIINNTLNTIDTSSSNYNFLLTIGSDFHGNGQGDNIGKICEFEMDEELTNIYNLCCMKTYKKLEGFICI